ncbi:excalibur calcium-binding domain-containing protein [Psychrobacillus sp. BL-248-WT-3]|uniref:excalibur calcium-binding domain-containing protein n=1 Tax=Psychrobacillus sp. BL-248-WT-3 TaxID=2725306 RepID=UPI00146EEE3A|nr:excalibur calcium-binding domain-containing protein [Psychrobacillus sp. BL-248-WT-3]NME06210.1 hypothetical protein [Psychrobacillus sp. BL-248-WT-3]
MQKWIGNRPTIGQKALVTMYGKVLEQARHTVINSTDTVLKVIEAEFDKKSGRDVNGVLVLTTTSILFLSKSENMVYTHDQVSDVRVQKENKDKNEWQLTMSIGYIPRKFDDIKINDDSKEFIEILKHIVHHKSANVLTTVTHDFENFLHADRLNDLRSNNVKITAFVMKRDNLGHAKNGERLLREKHRDAKLIAEGYYQSAKKKGNFVLVEDTDILVYEYDDKERTATLMNKWPFTFFSHAVIDQFAMKTVISREEGDLVLTSSGKKFVALLVDAKIAFVSKERKWYQKVLGFRSGKWWKRAVASLMYVFGFIIILALIFGEDTTETDAITPDTKTADEESKKTDAEADRLAEEQQKQEEADRLAEEQRKQEEAARLAEEKAKQEEADRLAEEQRKQEEARLAEEQRKQEEAARAEKEQTTNVYYKNCTQAREAGAAPVHQGEPGYGKHLDRDGDGIGCDR